MSKQPSLSSIVAIMDHDRAEYGYVLAPYIKPDGSPDIRTIARIVAIRPRDGMGRLRVAVTDWGTGPDTGHDPHQYIGAASGCGYDKMTAAMCGARIGGVEVGDWCDSQGRPQWRELCQSRGWRIVGARWM